MPTSPIRIDPQFSSPPPPLVTTSTAPPQSHSPTSPTSLFPGGKLTSSHLPPTFSSSPTTSSSSGSTASTPFAASPVGTRGGGLGYFGFSPVVVDTAATGGSPPPTTALGPASRWSFSTGSGAQVFAPKELKELKDLRELRLDDINPLVSHDTTMSTSTTLPSAQRRQSFAGLSVPAPPPPTLATSPPYISAMSGTGGPSSFLSNTLPLSRTISGGTGTAVGGVSAVEDKNARGRGVLRRLSLSGMVGAGTFKPNFMRSPSNAQVSNTDPFSPASSHTPLTPPSTTPGAGPATNHARTISFGDPFSQAIHEHDEHDHDDLAHFQTQQKVPVKTVGFAPVPQDEGRRVSAPVPSAKANEPVPGSLGHLFSRHSVATTSPTQPTHAETMPVHATPDGEIRRGGRPRRLSENAGNKKRGVSPMGEHILRGIQHF